MERNKPNKVIKNQLFQVEILMDDASNGKALEKLLHVLNTADFKDFRIIQGVELGKSIDEALKTNMNKKPINLIPTTQVQTTQQDAVFKKQIADMFDKFVKERTLIRLSILKEKGVKQSMPCRIMNYDVSNDRISVYHVDEKQVYSFNLNQIEDYVVSS